MTVYFIIINMIAFVTMGVNTKKEPKNMSIVSAKKRSGHLQLLVVEQEPFLE